MLAVIGLLCSISAIAHDFEVDGIYYNIISYEEKDVRGVIDLEKIDKNPQVSLDFKRFFIEWDKENKQQ